MSPQVYVPRRGRCETVLAVNLSIHDRRLLRTIFSSLLWRLSSVATLAEGVQRAGRQSVPVVVCERDLPDGSWKHLLDKVETLARPPRLIVASRLADERLWAEVLNLGGYDVLATPFDADEVYRVVSYAVDSWHFQFAGEKIRVVGQMS